MHQQEQYMQGWQANAKDTLANLQNVSPAMATKDQFMLYGAAMAILHPAEYHSGHGQEHGHESNQQDEMRDAHKYAELLRTTGKEGYRQLSLQKLHHMELLEDLEGKMPPELRQEHEKLLRELGGYQRGNW